jgi:hypothetical protein
MCDPFPFIEVVSKPHLRPNGCVAGLRQMLTYSSCMLRFLDRPALAEHLNLKKSSAKSRWQAAPLNLI